MQLTPFATFLICASFIQNRLPLLSWYTHPLYSPAHVCIRELKRALVSSTAKTSHPPAKYGEGGRGWRIGGSGGGGGEGSRKRWGEGRKVWAKIFISQGEPFTQILWQNKIFISQGEPFTQILWQNILLTYFSLISMIFCLPALKNRQCQ